MTGTSSEDDPEYLKQRIRDLETALNQRNDNLALAFQLSPLLNKLFGLLLSLPTVTTNMIAQRVGITADAKVAIHRLRKHLKSWEITVHSKRSLGYWIDEADKVKIRALIEKTKAANDSVVASPLAA
jgi:hypothetical protein